MAWPDHSGWAASFCACMCRPTQCLYMPAAHQSCSVPSDVPPGKHKAGWELGVNGLPVLTACAQCSACEDQQQSRAALCCCLLCCMSSAQSRLVALYVGCLFMAVCMCVYGLCSVCVCMAYVVSVKSGSMPVLHCAVVCSVTTSPMFKFASAACPCMGCLPLMARHSQHWIVLLLLTTMCMPVNA